MKEFEAVNMKMHKEMSMALTGNADVDFAQGMVPHHQGAIGMAKVVLKYGKDPEIKKARGRHRQGSGHRDCFHEGLARETA